MGVFRSLPHLYLPWNPSNEGGGFSEEENEESLGRWSNGKKSIFVLTVHFPFSRQQNFDAFSRSIFSLAAGHEEDLLFPDDDVRLQKKDERKKPLEHYYCTHLSLPCAVGAGNKTHTHTLT